jgi:hypothetical protein
MRISKLTSGERLRRKGQTQAPIEEKTFIGNLIVIGASAGGHHALEQILRDLSIDIPAAIIVLVHRPVDSVFNLRGMLEQFTRIPIVPVQSSEPLQHQTIFVLPPGKSATLHRGRIIVDGETVPDRPVTTINRLFTAAAKAYRERVIGVILSGFLKDGTDGLRAVHEAGGLTIVQDPVEAEYSSMPANAMAHLPVTFCLNLSDIGAALELLARRETQFETGLAVAVRTLRARTTLLVRLAEQSWGNPGTHEFLMNELASLRYNLSSVEDVVKDSSGVAMKDNQPLQAANQTIVKSLKLDLEDDLSMLEQHAKHVVSLLGRRVADATARVAALQESARLFEEIRQIKDKVHSLQSKP